MKEQQKEELSREEIIDHYKSDVEDLKYHYSQLLSEYATVTEAAGLGNAIKVIEAWSKDVINYPTIKL